MDYRLSIESLGVEVTLWKNTKDEVQLNIESKSSKKFYLERVHFINDKGLSIPIVIDGKTGLILDCVVSEDKPKIIKLTKLNPRVKTFKGVLKDKTTGLEESIEFDLQEDYK